MRDSPYRGDFLVVIITYPLSCIPHHLYGNYHYFCGSFGDVSVRP